MDPDLRRGDDDFLYEKQYNITKFSHIRLRYDGVFYNKHVKKIPAFLNKIIKKAGKIIS